MKSFGLLGRKLSHSISPEIHSYFYQDSYVLFEKEPEELDEFFKERNFSGINVTIPYKKDVIKYCDELSETAKKIGSVNTITIKNDGTLYGDNSDYYGFNYMVEKSGINIEGKTVLVLGTGGASLTVKACLEALNAKKIFFVARTGEVNYKNVYDFSDCDVIINATPVGMFPNNGERLLDLSKFPRLSGVLDLIYNPMLTPILYDAEKLGIPYINGLSMLVAQAKMSAEKFINKNIADSEIERIIKQLESRRKNIVLIGMPGSGKSTLCKELANSLSRQGFDTDSFVEETQGTKIPDIFNFFGEEYFRKLETKACIELGKKSGAIIATGGGACMKEENRYALKQNGFVVLLKRNISKLSTADRPLSKNEEALKKLQKERMPVYETFADAVVEVEEDVNVTLNKVLRLTEECL